MDLISPEVLAAFLSGIAGPLAIQWLQWNQDKKKSEKKDLIKESLETSLQVEQKIDYILEEYKADRVIISQFHNGGYYYPTGKSIQKFSIVYETVAAGVDSIQSNFQNIPISLFGKAINHVSEEDILFIPDHNLYSRNDTFNLNPANVVSKTKSNYIFAIRSIEGKFIGMLSLHYVKNKRTLTQEELLHIGMEVSSIGGVLMNLLKLK